jgi:hypothetical protein
MIREGHNDVVFFTGTEVEHTPAYGKKTLFVVGLPSITKIQDWARTQHCEHIYFGANMSFPNLAVNDAEEWKKWEDTIQYFLKADYFCTLDIDVSCVEGLTESALCEHHNFIPMISVKLPYLQQLGYNATIKLDDKDFKATNPGVWCHSLHNLMDRQVFTDWSKYTKDETL